VRDRLIHGGIAALIAWGVTHSSWVTLAVFGIAAGLSNDKFKWLDEILKGLKDEYDKQIGKAKKTEQASLPAAETKPLEADKSVKIPAGTATKGNAAMLKNKTSAAGVARTDKISMKSVDVQVAATKVEQLSKEIPMFVKMIVAVILAAAAGFMTQSPGAAVGVFLAAFFIALIIEGVRIVPQQNAWVVERLGKFHASLQPGFNLIVPFIDRVAYRHSLKEVPLDIAEQVCITRDNTQLAVDGIIYFQVVDPRLASYGTSDYELAISQLAQTALRSEVGKMELDKTFESRDEINQKIVSVLDEAGRTWGIKVLRYEIKSLTPPESILRSMQAQITAEREKRALIAKSEGIRQEEINIADGQRQAAILASEGEKQAAINKSQGEATALTTVAEATASAVRQVAAALSSEGGMQAANLKVAEKYVEQFGNLAKAGNTLIIPANLADAGSFVASAMTVLDKAKIGQGQK
jgi:regulator of protease activity HflC (stomatin/prohibitin superfamily)